MKIGTEKHARAHAHTHTKNDTLIGIAYSGDTKQFT